MNLYEMYCDGDKFYDLRVQELALEDPQLDLAVNDAGQLTFTIPANHPKENIFKPLTSTIEVFRDGEWMWEGRVIDKKGSFNNSYTYTVEGALGYLNDSIQPQSEFHDINPIGYVERLLNIHNSMVPDNRKIYLGAVTVTDPNDSLYRYTNFNSTLQELKEDIIDDLGGYLRLRKVDGKLYLDVLKEYDRTCSQQIEIGKNLIDLTPSFDYKEIASVIIPLGARIEEQEDYTELEALDKYVTIEDVNGGKNYIARQDYLDQYDQIWQVVHFDNVHTPQNLLRKAQEYLEDGIWDEMVIEAKAFDLNYTSEEFQEFRLGDKVRVTSEIHGIDRYFPITAQTIYFNNISENSITLGGNGSSVTITGVTNSITINTEKLDERIKEPNRLIQQAIYQATQLIEQGLNGYVRVSGNEILIMDTDDPETAKNVWRWNMGGLGYSSNGYHGPFETAITMDGTITGKFIAANSIAAEQIDVNYTSRMEKQIDEAESNANDYTDGKLKNYWTARETEVHFQTTADSILSSVSSTYVTKNSLGNLETRIQSTEQKITEDGIFTTINNGIAGTKEIHSTKMSLTKNGLAVDGGSIEILNGDFTIMDRTRNDVILKLDSPYNGGNRCLNVTSSAWFGSQGYTYIENNNIYFSESALPSYQMTLEPQIGYGTNAIYTSSYGSDSSNGLVIRAPSSKSIGLYTNYTTMIIGPNALFYSFDSRHTTYIQASSSLGGSYQHYKGYTGSLSGNSNLQVVHGLVVERV